jgi:Phosphoglycerate dehydrogenase and related dehydrogenases
MNIAIPDDYQKVIQTLNCFDLLKNHETLIFHEYVTDEDELVKQFQNADAIVLTRTRTKITASLLAKLPRLKAISQTGKNAGHIDEAACKKYGVSILETKGNPIATAELTWTLILNGLRQLPQAIEGMKAGKWQTNIGRRVHGKTIGIWGYGKIGKRIANFAKAFEAKVMVWGSEASRQLAVDDGFLAAESKTKFFQIADVITIHLRLKETTKNIVKLDDLRLMKKDALFVNTARAGLIEKNALVTALKSGRPGFAAIDVFEEEPIFDKNHPLLQMPNVICTPHLGYVERAGYELYFSQAFQSVIDFFQSKS